MGCGVRTYYLYDGTVPIVEMNGSGAVPFANTFGTSSLMIYPTLLAVMENLDALPEYYAIYGHRVGRSWDASAECVVAEEDEDGFLEREFDGIVLHYILDVGLVRNVLEVWGNWRGRATLSADEKVRATLYYAEHDAFEPTE